VGEYFGRGNFKKKILDVKHLSNGWYVLKTENSKDPLTHRDFRVRTVYQLEPRLRSFTPKHAHFVIDFFGKLMENRERGLKFFNAIIEIWYGTKVEEILNKYDSQVKGAWGYNLEYVLHAMNWILEQEDINFKGRPAKKQQEINEILVRSGVKVLMNRLGSQLAISLFCNVLQGMHPVEAFIRANLDVIPLKKSFGTR
jgi:hypothetical protein